MLTLFWPCHCCSFKEHNVLYDIFLFYHFVHHYKEQFVNVMQEQVIFSLRTQFFPLLKEIY